MIILDCEQGGDIWQAARASIPTGSNFDKIYTSTGKASTQRKAYMNKLLAEHLTGQPIESYKSASMDLGSVREAESRDLYELINDVEVQQVGLVYLDDRKIIATSPDGLTPDGGYETKCPDAHTHVEYLLTNKIPIKYKVQVQGNIWVCERDHWDFMSYYPGMPPLITRVDRDTRFIKGLSEELEYFVDEMLEKREKLQALK